MRAGERQAADQHLGAAQGRFEAELAEAVAELEQLGGAAMRRRWRSLVGSSLPEGLGRPLSLRVLAYKLQAQHLGDLDKASLRELASTVGLRIRKRVSGDADLTGSSPDPKSGDKAEPTALVPAPAKPRSFTRPGTVLVREYGGVRHRVMVLDAGVAWNGKTFDSLSQVAFAITGTRWNGPRFFGLRDKAAKDDKGSVGRPLRHRGQGVRSRQSASSPTRAVSPAQDRP